VYFTALKVIIKNKNLNAFILPHSVLLYKSYFLIIFVLRENVSVHRALL